MMFPVDVSNTDGKAIFTHGNYRSQQRGKRKDKLRRTRQSRHECKP